MPRTLGSPRHEALHKFIKDKRERSDLTQHELAQLICRSQSYITAIETGQRRIDVVELVELAAALGFDPQAALRLVKSIKSP
jgi:transcriptional regulator with XRE-family HTH domain